MRRGPPEPRLPLVLPPRPGRRGAGPPTFSKNRHGRFRGCDLLRRLFEATVRRCMAEGTVGGQGFKAGASTVRADANRQNGLDSPEELDPADASRAVTEYLAALDDAAFGRRPRWRRSPSRPPIPPRAGRRRPAARLAAPTATTTWSTPSTREAGRAVKEARQGWTSVHPCYHTTIQGRRRACLRGSPGRGATGGKADRRR